MAAQLGGTFEGVVVLNPRQLSILLDSPQGPVVRDMMKRGREVQAEAKKRVGVYKPPPAGPQRRRRPGTLRDRIVVRTIAAEGKGAGSVAVIVGSEDPIALWHHEGTRPHIIVPKARKRAQRSHLVFWSWRAGRVIFAKRVNHPGTRPNRFLTDSLSVVNKRNR